MTISDPVTGTYVGRHRAPEPPDRDDPETGAPLPTTVVGWAPTGVEFRPADYVDWLVLRVRSGEVITLDDDPAAEVWMVHDSDERIDPAVVELAIQRELLTVRPDGTLAATEQPAGGAA
jgi:hypothetical protein